MDLNNDIKPGHQIVNDFHFHPYWHQDNAQAVLSSNNSSDILKKEFLQRKKLPLPSETTLFVRLLRVT